VVGVAEEEAARVDDDDDDDDKGFGRLLLFAPVEAGCCWGPRPGMGFGFLCGKQRQQDRGYASESGG